MPLLGFANLYECHRGVIGGQYCYACVTGLEVVMAGIDHLYERVSCFTEETQPKMFANCGVYSKFRSIELQSENKIVCSVTGTVKDCCHVVLNHKWGGCPGKKGVEPLILMVNVWS